MNKLILTYSKSTLLSVALGAFLTLQAPYVYAETNLSAREIMERVDVESRKSTDSAFTRMKLTTCKYGLSGGKVKCAEKARVKLIENAQINTGEGNQDTKSIAIILEPASEKGIGMLSYSYDDSDRDNETWLYLSALGKVKRISVRNSDDEETESASIFGTEMTTEDQETGKLDDYSYELLEFGTFRGREVAVVEATPKKHRISKSSYGKTQNWIDTERFITLKVQMFDKYNNPIKKLEVGKVEKINDVWMGRSLTFFNTVSNRLTNMKLEAINFDMDIKEDFLTQRALTDQAFREKFLKDLRKQAK
ncbi:outer membrane lipoprotein-sorting protein [Candidatus Thioglobus sp.]|nr:outer membrane lipoprotein-sorting protein [Candidatus Thioglobus sp.]